MTQRTREEIGVDIAAARAARTRFINGETITEVTKDGRSMKFAGMKLSDFNAVIADLLAEFDAAPELDGGEPPRRRRAIRLGWAN